MIVPTSVLWQELYSSKNQEYKAQNETSRTILEIRLTYLGKYQTKKVKWKVSKRLRERLEAKNFQTFMIFIFICGLKFKLSRPTLTIYLMFYFKPSTLFVIL